MKVVKDGGNKVRELHDYTVEELQRLWDEGLSSSDAKPLSASFALPIKERGRAQLNGDGTR